MTSKSEILLLVDSFDGDLAYNNQSKKLVKTTVQRHRS